MKTKLKRIVDKCVAVIAGLSMILPGVPVVVSAEETGDVYVHIHVVEKKTQKPLSHYKYIIYKEGDSSQTPVADPNHPDGILSSDDNGDIFVGKIPEGKYVLKNEYHYSSCVEAPDTHFEINDKLPVNITSESEGTMKDYMSIFKRFINSEDQNGHPIDGQELQVVVPKRYTELEEDKILDQWKTGEQIFRLKTAQKEELKKEGTIEFDTDSGSNNLPYVPYGYKEGDSCHVAIDENIPDELKGKADYRVLVTPNGQSNQKNKDTFDMFTNKDGKELYHSVSYTTDDHHISVNVVSSPSEIKPVQTATVLGSDIEKDTTFDITTIKNVRNTENQAETPLKQDNDTDNKDTDVYVKVNAIEEVSNKPISGDTFFVYKADSTLTPAGDSKHPDGKYVSDKDGNFTIGKLPKGDYFIKYYENNSEGAVFQDANPATRFTIDNNLPVTVNLKCKLEGKDNNPLIEIFYSVCSVNQKGKLVKGQKLQWVTKDISTKKETIMDEWVTGQQIVTLTSKQAEELKANGRLSFKTNKLPFVPYGHKEGETYNIEITTTDKTDARGKAEYFVTIEPKTQGKSTNESFKYYIDKEGNELYRFINRGSNFDSKINILSSPAGVKPTGEQKHENEDGFSVYKIINSSGTENQAETSNNQEETKGATGGETAKNNQGNNTENNTGSAKNTDTEKDNNNQNSQNNNTENNQASENSSSNDLNKNTDKQTSSNQNKDQSINKEDPQNNTSEDTNKETQENDNQTSNSVSPSDARPISQPISQQTTQTPSDVISQPNNNQSTQPNAKSGANVDTGVRINPIPVLAGSSMSLAGLGIVLQKLRKKKE